MAGEPSGDAALQQELAAQQQAAQDYHPELEGPVIGEKRPSEAVTEEYAKADPIYVEKTVNLPQTYSHFRPVQGDGNCGWRAIGFSYFEKLILVGGPDKLPLEVARMTSLNNYLTNVGGYDLDLFEDMVFETINLLKDLAQCATDPSIAMTLLQNRFNDRDCSNAIIYHLRLLAGAWLKGNAAQYEPFLDGAGDVASWAHQNIEVPDKEIDHLSIILLTNILLKPADMVLEIAYLDRTPGAQVNTYRFPDEANGQDPVNLGTIIYLLFRPDHYDILYKDSSDGGPPALPTPTHGDLQVNRAMSFTQQHEVVSNVPSLHDFSAMDYGTLAMLPGFGGPPSDLSALAAPTAISPVQEPYATPDQRSWMTPSHSIGPMQQTAPLPQSETHFQPYQPPPTPSTQCRSKGNQQPVDYQLRFSSQCFHLQNPSVESSAVSQGGFLELNCGNGMIKNGHFSKAHYRNPEFHPEEWTPEDETGERGGSCRKKIRSNPEE